MKRKILLLIIFTILWGSSIAQKDWAENLRRSAMQGLKSAKDDQARLDLNSDIFASYIWSYPDSALPYAHQVMLLAQRLKSDEALVTAYSQMIAFAEITGNYPQALRYGFEGLKAAERTKDFLRIVFAYAALSTTYNYQGDHPRAILYAQKSKAMFDANFTPSISPLISPDTLVSYMYVLSAVGQAFEKNNQTDSALKYMQVVEQSEQILHQSWAFVPFTLGNIYSKKGTYLQAITYYQRAKDTATQNNSKKDLMEICYGLANTFKLMGQLDSAIFYANRVLEINKATRYLIIKADACQLLAAIYKRQNKIDSTAKYFELTLAAKDSLFNQDKILEMQDVTLNEQLRQQSIEDERQTVKKQKITYALSGGLMICLAIILMLNHNRRQKQKAKIKIEKAYAELKSAQAQLIQSEKMASLGELTAGIAHEIQNPLNFVNNFSEVNKELANELKSELATGYMHSDSYRKAIEIADNIINNEEKINHHGKRADVIVKNMLQHSRASTGQKEPTDVNALADEYLRLSYHGMRAKDKSFNATLHSNLDPSIGKLNIVPQEIGRVLLNLYNNAFYAVNEKKKQSAVNYEPRVAITTEKVNGTVTIAVKDNGTGIPQKIREKIFQPFFTTKPTGQGTGLGLSLAYDIVNAHGGELKVETKEGEGSRFIIQLPVIHL